MGALGNLKDEVAEIQERLRKKALNDFKPALKDFAKKLQEVAPTVKAVRWQQYTPHFNDGDACVFSIRGVYALIDGANEEDSDYEDGYTEVSFYPEDLKKSSKERLWGLTQLVKEEKLSFEGAELLVEFESELNQVEPLAEAAFGDGVEVTLHVKSGRLTVEEHEHD